MCAILALFLWHAPAHAQTGPVPPCGGETVPHYPQADSSLVTKFWRPADVGKDWKVPTCTGWTNPGFSTLVTTAARFHYADGAEGLLRRIGAVSELAGVRYWSVTHKSWQTLIVTSTALAGQRGKPRGTDFTPDEIRNGDVVYFQQADNLMGKASYSLRVMESSDDRIVFNVENVDTMHYFLFTLAGVGEMQSIHFLDRESPDVWRYYGIVRTGKKTSGLITGNTSSSINRAVAFYRHYAGIPTDQEPPPAR